MAEKQMIEKLWEQLAKKDEQLWEQLEKKEKQLGEQLKKKDEQKDKLYEDLMKEKDEMTKLEIRNNNLVTELEKKNTEYLRVTGSLHIRGVCEEFERSFAILANKKCSRELKWKNMLASEEFKCVEVRECLQKCNLDIEQVPNIAKGLFDKINSDVDGNFTKSKDDLHIIKSYFTPDELTLIKCIIECYKIERVVYSDNIPDVKK